MLLVHIKQQGPLPWVLLVSAATSVRWSLAHLAEQHVCGDISVIFSGEQAGEQVDVQEHCQQLPLAICGGQVFKDPPIRAEVRVSKYLLACWQRCCGRQHC